jgi:nucleoside-diphosphate-sugar epimerase
MGTVTIVRPVSASAQLIGPVVVTGGAGFLGREVLTQLLAQGQTDVRLVDLAPFEGKVPAGARFFKLDLRSDDLSEAFEGAKTVLHLAACQYHTPLAKSTYDLPFFEVNVDATGRVIEAAEKAKATRHVFVSTNMVYGLPQSLPLPDDHPTDPFGPYGQSKLKAEALVRASHDRGLDSAIVRPGLIIGPGRGGVIARVFDWILTNKPVVLVGSGNNHYEMMHVADVASLVLAAGAHRGFGVYNCRAKEVPTMREWMQAVIQKAGSRSKIIGIPGAPLKFAFRWLETVRLSPLRKDQYLIADRDYFMSSGRAEKELGWAPKWTGTDAILDTFRWYTSGKKLPDPTPPTPVRSHDEQRSRDAV